MSWAEFMHLGASTPDDELQQRLSLQAVNQCCTLIYTSGTTGPPKGVMCSQDNITWSARAIADFFSLKHDDSIVSYLPLNHIAAQMVDLYVAMPSRKLDVLVAVITVLVQPTEFLTVPRLLEKIHEQLTAASAESSPAKRAVAAWAKREGSNYYRALREGRRLTQKEQLRYRLAKMLVFSKVKKALGLTNCRNLTSGSAPLSPELVEFFFSLDLPQSNVWALSESCGIGTINHLHEDRYRTGSVGKAVPGAKISIQKSDVSSRQGEGEICMKGRNVFMGYFNNKEKTDETIQDDGWMRTGDLGHLDEDGFLYVSGRAKEIIITAGGENIAPLPIEAAVKKLIPAVANAVVVGDGKKYLSMLLTFCCSVDPDTMVPHDSLSAPALDWLRGLGSAVTTVTQLRDEVQQQPNGIIATAIQAAIDVYNSEHATSRIHQLKRWSVLPHDFSLATGELNNTLKLKRSYVTEKYSELIEEIYSR
ncbi:long-chain-fatty-acid--CoA ligase ACSBG2 [Hyalella azteca]|uniref:long-chain-fatty-acid--CoA ligase n=1 Tax=Hyalella azteca TaxID=294128 RepID=A0A8B7NZU4_HYAAZ|nr:long-chain-fatty-acid--CoA ligase ACSBG2 [Hyalella azteca]